MTYTVFGGMLNFAQLNFIASATTYIEPGPPVNTKISKIWWKVMAIQS